MAGTNPALTTSIVDATLNKSDNQNNPPRGARGRGARALGFDCIGVTEPGTIDNAGKYFLEFIASGGHGDMDWLAAQPEGRGDPRRVLQGEGGAIIPGVHFGPHP